LSTVSIPGPVEPRTITVFAANPLSMHYLEVTTKTDWLSQDNLSDWRDLSICEI